MADIDDRIPHPTHLGLNIAKTIPDDRPEPDGDGLTPHPDPSRVAWPVREVLPEDGALPSEAYLDQIAEEAGSTLARVWELPHDLTVQWIRQALVTGLSEGDAGSGDQQPDADRDTDHDEQRSHET